MCEFETGRPFYLEGVQQRVKLPLRGRVVAAGRPVPRLRVLREPDELLAVVDYSDHVVREVHYAGTVREVTVLYINT